MTDKPCKACSHPDRGVMDRALALGQAPRSVVRRYSGISRREIQKHRDECLAATGGAERSEICATR